MSPQRALYKNEVALYILLSERVIDEVESEVEMSRNHILVFCWIHYINKIILKLDYVNINATARYMKAVFVDQRIISEPLIRKVLAIMHEKKFINMVGDKYILDVRAGGFVARFSHKFMERVAEFHSSVEDNKKVLWFPKPRRVRKNAKRGWPKGKKRPKRTHKYVRKNKSITATDLPAVD